MSKFSEHLEVAIMRSGLTELQLAKVSGFTRSYIALMKSGRRVSPDAEKMERLMHALNLPPYEYEELWGEYIRARIGEHAYERDAAVKDLICSFSNTSDISISSSYPYEIPDMKTINDRMGLHYLIKAVIHNESLLENGYVRIIMQGEDSILSQILPIVCKANKNLRVDHIVCLQKYADSGSGTENDQLYNVKMMKKLIPTVVFSSSINYHVLYYYDHVAARSYDGMLLPYMVLTSEYLICIDFELNKGILFREPEILQMYDQMFQERKKNCKQMFQYVENMADMLDWHTSKSELDHTTYSIAQQPCFGLLRIDNLIKKYDKTRDKSLIFMLEEINRKNREWIAENDNRHIAFCTKEGLNRFMSEGIVDELPRELYRCLNEEDRKNVLQMLKEMIENGSYELYLLDEDFMKIPRELFISVYGTSSVVLVYLSEEKPLRFVLAENSMTRIFYDSLRDLMKSPRITSNEMTLSYLKNILSECK